VQFDRRQRFSDEPLTVCPECETETLRKVYLPVGIVFKGSGFYATDNRSPSGRESRSADEKSGGEEKSSKKNKEEPPQEKKKSKVKDKD
jgi:putative FmdB family regulatory protein